MLVKDLKFRIVKKKNSWGNYSNCSNEKCPCNTGFKNGRFIIEGYEKIFPHYSFYDFVLKDKGIKIIGNIHENPELWR